MKMSAVLIAACLAGGVMADDKDAKSEKKSPSAAAASSTVATKLKGKLVSLQEKKLADHELKGEPEFYVFYHSASW